MQQICNHHEVEHGVVEDTPLPTTQGVLVHLPEVMPQTHTRHAQHANVDVPLVQLMETVGAHVPMTQEDFCVRPYGYAAAQQPP